MIVEKSPYYQTFSNMTKKQIPLKSKKIMPTSLRSFGEFMPQPCKKFVIRDHQIKDSKSVDSFIHTEWTHNQTQNVNKLALEKPRP